MIFTSVIRSDIGGVNTILFVISPLFQLLCMCGYVIGSDRRKDRALHVHRENKESVEFD